MDESTRQKDQQIAHLTTMMQQLTLSLEQERDSRRTASAQLNQGPPQPAKVSGGQGDLPRESQYRNPSPQRFNIGSQQGDRDSQLSKPKEAESIKLRALPNAAGFRQWKQDLRDEVVSASGYPEQAFLWINRTETLSLSKSLPIQQSLARWTLSSQQLSVGLPPARLLRKFYWKKRGWP